MTICIGGSKHGQDVKAWLDTIEFAIVPPVLVKWEPEIRLQLTPEQREIAERAGIPTSVPRPIQPAVYAKEVYHRHTYAVSGLRVDAYVLAGIDAGSKQTVRTVELLTWVSAE